MKSKVKVLLVTLVMVAVAGVLLYAPLTSALQCGEGQESDVDLLNNGNFDAYCRRERWFKARRGWWFLNHSEPVELEGTAVILFKDMFIIDTAEGQMRIHLPQAWTVSGQLAMREELFDGGYVSEGENMVVKALRADVIDKKGLCVNVLLGYEIIDESGISAYAILPFNIEA